MFEFCFSIVFIVYALWSKQMKDFLTKTLLAAILGLLIGAVLGWIAAYYFPSGEVSIVQIDREGG